MEDGAGPLVLLRAATLSGYIDLESRRRLQMTMDVGFDLKGLTPSPEILAGSFGVARARVCVHQYVCVSYFASTVLRG